MKPLQITEKAAKVLYPTAPADLKAMLEKHFSKKVLTDSIMDRIKSFSDAYPAFMKMKFKDALYIALQKRKAADLTAIDRLMIIAEVLRENWNPDWSNGDQKKYFAYFEYKKTSSGLGFSYHVCDRWLTATRVGSRLCFPTAELATYFGSNKEFLKLHNEYLLINR